MKTSKPIYEGIIYSIIKRNGSFAVVLSGNTERVQYSGPRMFCLEWVQENDIQQAA